MIETTEIQILTLVMITFLLGFVIGDYVSKNEIMNMNEFKIRCSAINSIMAKPTGKRIISVGAQTYCDKWYKEKIFERKKRFIVNILTRDKKLNYQV